MQNVWHVAVQTTLHFALELVLQLKSLRAAVKLDALVLMPPRGERCMVTDGEIHNYVDLEVLISRAFARSWLLTLPPVCVFVKSCISPASIPARRIRTLQSCREYWGSFTRSWTLRFQPYRSTEFAGSVRLQSAPPVLPATEIGNRASR